MATSDGLRLMKEVDGYVAKLYAHEDRSLKAGLRAASKAGLPQINVSATEGRLLYLLARLSGAQRILEIGTLGGYSTLWLARALPATGRLISLELDGKHAKVARANMKQAGMQRRVEIRVGPALDSLKGLVRERVKPFDLVFIDADKTNYVRYLELALKLTRSGSLILGDNVIRHGEVLHENGNAANRAIRAFNRKLAVHPRLESTILPLMREHIDGLSVARVR